MKKQNIIFASLFILFGVLISIAPFTFAKVCEVGEKVMKCHWTAHAELFLGIEIAVLGAAKFILACRNYQIGLAIAEAVNGLGVILFPTVLIGVCKMKTMHCVSVAKPFLIVAGIVVLAVAVAQIALIVKSKIAEKK